MRSFRLFVFAAFFALFPLLGGCNASDNSTDNVVVVYSSLDEEFAKPLAEQIRTRERQSA